VRICQRLEASDITRCFLINVLRPFYFFPLLGEAAACGGGSL
jgi:hypothetical protein